ncbi:MAG: ArsC family reductase [Gammaproteobacteria bacterium]|nr:ArsC family reductase [Gammaproteobacteria bacterium]
MIKLYGIPNCDTIKKARKWLTDNNIKYEFYDYKKQGVPEKALKKWIKQLGWEILLNKRGTTWRKLDDTTKNSIDQTSAIQLMLDYPSIIKRPVLDLGNKYEAGFTAEKYQQLFENKT